tara:strand:- start:181 stop:1059 length:879 start_codon:yes stop_codon:yes gene_type:complete
MTGATGTTMDNKIVTLFGNRSEIEKPVAQCAVGNVYLVGAGPGDPELITLKAVRLLKQADVIVYDRLANPALLDYASDSCALIYAGKKKNNHSLSQQQICEMLAMLARRGKTVVRLKGGDPFIFGRGGEEIDYLDQQGIGCHIVPGITAAIGCAAATKIPLTHRDYAHGVTFITGHRQAGRLSINWDLALQKDTTMVFYMGLSKLREITDNLLQRGCCADKPFAIVAQGTDDQQRVLLGTTGDIADKLQRNPLRSPALLIMGDVVRANRYASQLADLASQDAAAASEVLDAS